MRLFVRHGRRTPKQPLIPKLEKWLQNAVLFPQTCALMVSLILITMSRCASSATLAPTRPTSASTTEVDIMVSTASPAPDTSPANPYAKSWPLRYHYSQWLRQEFVDEYRPEASCELTQATDQCRTNRQTFQMSYNRTSNQNNSHFVNVSASSLPSNGSAVKISLTMANKAVTGETSSLLRTRPGDGPTATSAAPKFLDSLLVSNNQCLFLDGKSAKTICDSSLGVPRLSLLEQYHLKYCDRYPLVSVLSYHAWQWLLHSHDFNSEQCEQILSELVMIDQIVSQMICEYDSLLERFDCQNGFSVIWSCDHCRVSNSLFTLNTALSNGLAMARMSLSNLISGRCGQPPNQPINRANIQCLNN